MTPRKVRRARRLVNRKWYRLFRSWWFGMMAGRYERAIFRADPRKLGDLSEKKTRCAIKQAWYINKLK